MNKLDKQIYEILNDFINHNLEVTYGEATSKIKQSILKAIMEAKPKKDIPRLGSENQDEYVIYSNGFNNALQEFESVIKEVLK